MKETHRLNILVQAIREGCTECGACVRQCAFLTRYGTPKSIVTTYDFSTPPHQRIAYSCSLCGLCATVCPENLDPGAFFLDTRRAFAAAGHLDKRPYRAILWYERLGTSPLFSWYDLPENCDTIFFPGCALPGTRPESTQRLFGKLKTVYPTVGMVLDCCSKPSHDLGLTTTFANAFNRLLKRLYSRGIQNVLVACPNCFKIFKQYAPNITVRMVYEVLPAPGRPLSSDRCATEFCIHDPCSTRRETSIHQAVRELLVNLKIPITEMKHRGTHTICCGEGGMAGYVAPELASSWSTIRKQEAAGRPTITYCAGCTGLLNRTAPTIHIADLYIWGDRAVRGQAPVSSGLRTYLNRLLLKYRLKNRAL